MIADFSREFLLPRLSTARAGVEQFEVLDWLNEGYRWSPTVSTKVVSGLLAALRSDFFYEPRNDAYEGLCIYLDGMRRHLHGRPETRDRDRDVREGLRNRGYEVVEIQFGQLTDRDAMRQHFFRIGRFLLGKDVAQRTLWRRYILPIVYLCANFGNSAPVVPRYPDRSCPLRQSVIRGRKGILPHPSRADGSFGWRISCVG